MNEVRAELFQRLMPGALKRGIAKSSQETAICAHLPITSRVELQTGVLVAYQFASGAIAPEEYPDVMPKLT